MNPIRFHIAATGLDAAEAVLAHYLPGLDVRLLPFSGGTVLLAPHLNLALELQYEPAGARAVFQLAGLEDGTAVDPESVFRWARRHAEQWNRAVPKGAIQEKESGELDWHLRMCAVGKAWDRVGQPGRIDWSGLRIGHIDTGYTDHPAFGPAGASWMDRERARTFATGTPAGNGVDALTGPSGGHGTGSASVYCAHDIDAAYFGVAPRVPVVPVRIGDCVIIDDQAREFEVAVRYLVEEVRVDVINVSMGTFLKAGPPKPIRRAIDLCYERGVILIAAAGNVPVPEWPAFPAALPRAIAIAGVTRKSEPWFSSSYSRGVALSAPAGGVKRAQTKPGSQYDYTDSYGGTTFAAAMTTGAAALWLLAHRDAIQAKYVQPWQRIEAFREMARKTATVPTGWLADRGFGAGILHVGRLMDADLLPDGGGLVRR